MHDPDLDLGSLEPSLWQSWQMETTHEFDFNVWIYIYLFIIIYIYSHTTYGIWNFSIARLGYLSIAQPLLERCPVALYDVCGLQCAHLSEKQLRWFNFFDPNCKIISALCWGGTCLGSHCDLLWNVESYIKIYKEDQCCLKTRSEASWFWTTMTTIQTVKPQPKRNEGTYSKCTYYIQKMHVSCVFKKLCRVCIYEYIKIYLYIRCHWCHLYHCLKKKRRGSRTNHQFVGEHPPSSRADFLRACAELRGQDMAGLLKTNDMPLFQ